MSSDIRKRKIEGHWMKLDIANPGISRVLFNEGKREEAFMWLLRKESFGVGLDVGANIGYCTVSMAEMCTKVIALEPDFRSMKLLRKNIKMNKLHNVDVYPYAISDEDKTIKLYLAKKPNMTSVRNILEEGDCIHEQEVQCYAIDTFPDTTPVDFVKMDIEGEEVGALAGGISKLHEKGLKRILIEVHPQAYDEKNDMRAILGEYLKKYRMKYIVNAKGKRDEFKSLSIIKSFKKCDRSVYAPGDIGTMIDWICTMPDDGKKLVRSFLMEKQ